ncbi:ESPR-type extended signal peptide-containing protein [Pinirhizobacter soli]|uniref:ESPR-type extended signal peptide-containing protein n=1 Tax=Pinirhizobacter soli TaxID=2786953 RepID=UPI00202A0802|nr:ESPR-type extended signal peptide-containing protein [Pinirhizobacter soli]
MNTIYRIVWNVTLGKWVVASELAKGRKKKSSLKTAMLSLAVVGAMASIGAPGVYAADITMPSCVAGEDSHETGCVPTSGEQQMTPFFADGGGNDGGRADNVAIGSGATTASQNSVAIGANAKSNGISGVALGAGARAMFDNGVAIGAASTATYASAVAIGAHAAAAKESVALGNGAKAVSNNDVAIGSKATAAMDSVAVGQGAIAVGGSTSVGQGAKAAGANSVALGRGSLALRANTVSVGSAGNERQIVNVAEGTQDTDAVNVAQLKKAGLVGGDGGTLDAVVYDAGSSRGSVTFGGLGGTKLTNVMAGIVSATSTDAVNGSQLWILQDQVGKLGDRVTNIESNGVPGNGPFTPPPAPGDSGRDPAFATTGDGDPAAATGKDSVAAGTGASATADNSVAIGAGSVADRADTVSVGSAGHERVVSNVAAGSQRTDAANWGQVQDALATANRYTDDRFDGVNRRIGEVQRQANRGIAASAALINVTPYMPGKTVLNAGVANYRGESALGVGVSRWNDTGRVNFNAGMSAAAGDSPIFRMGVGVVLGD